LDEKYYTLIIVFSVLSGALAIALLILVWQYKIQKKKHDEVAEHLKNVYTPDNYLD